MMVMAIVWSSWNGIGVFKYAIVSLVEVHVGRIYSTWVDFRFRLGWRIRVAAVCSLIPMAMVVLLR